MVEDGDVAARHVRHEHLVPILDELAQNPAHRDDVVVGMRREADRALAGGELALAANLRAERIEHFAVHRTGRSRPGDERGHAVFGVVALRQLENGPLRLLGEPHDRADLERLGPADFVQQPRCGNARQLRARRLIDVKGRVGMALQKGRRDLEVDVAFDRPPQNRRLVLARGEQGDLARIENGRDAHRHRFLGHELLAEEIGGGVAPRHRIEMHDTRAAVRAGARFVEADVARLPDAENLEVDPAGALDLRLVTQAFRLDVNARSVPPRDMNVPLRDIDVREEILPHEAVIRVDVVRRHRVVFVEIERHDVGEAQPVVPMHPDQLAIHANGRGARGEAEDDILAGRSLLPNQRRDARGDHARQILMLFTDDGANPLECVRAGLNMRWPASRRAIAGRTPGADVPRGASDRFNHERCGGVRPRTSCRSRNHPWRSDS